MRDNYRSRVVFLLFIHIMTINIILFSFVFFSYATIFKKDYGEKLLSVARQTAANVHSTLYFFEEEIELFINKYDVIENLETFQIDEPNSIRTDSTSFGEIVIFRGEEPVYISNAGEASFYRGLFSNDNFSEKMKDKQKMWMLKETDEEFLKSYDMLNYVRSLYHPQTGERCGYIVATVSTDRFAELLNLDTGLQSSRDREFVPVSAGISIDNKVFFLGEKTIEKEDVTLEDDHFYVKGKEVCVMDLGDGRKFFAVYSRKKITKIIVSVLILLIVLLFVISIFSYKTLKFLLDAICDRINHLNYKMENYYPEVDDA